jgi:hypothetical protein
MKSFEQHLRRQQPREIPSEWRSQILCAAEAASVQGNLRMPDTLIARLGRQIRAYLWPHPIAWAALGASWVVILVVNLSLHEPSPMMAKKSAPVTPDTLAELKRERVLFAEVAGLSEVPDVERAKKNALEPRTENGGQAMA